MKYLILILFFPVLVSATTIQKCGNYYAEGYYTEIKSFLHKMAMKKMILLNRGTNSEIKFYIQNQNIDALIPPVYLGVNFQLTLQFTSLCFYHCEGLVVANSITTLDPFTPPKSFMYPRPELIAGSEINCKPNSFEKTEDPKSSK